MSLSHKSFTVDDRKELARRQLMVFCRDILSEWDVRNKDANALPQSELNALHESEPFIPPEEAVVDEKELSRTPSRISRATSGASSPQSSKLNMSPEKQQQQPFGVGSPSPPNYCV
eukprot:PhF_6_TR21928/c0_g1_i1/m.31148